MGDEWDANLLGAYIRARRELVTPEQVGIPVTGTRRVSGLRREEVAMLAGISAEYYLRLEQGRDRRPSPQILESIARVLDLDESHLVQLAEQTATPHRHRRRSRRHAETLPASTARLIETMPMPAFAEGRYLDVLAANPLATAISPRLAAGRNRLHLRCHPLRPLTHRRLSRLQRQPDRTAMHPGLRSQLTNRQPVAAVITTDRLGHLHPGPHLHGPPVRSRTSHNPRFTQSGWGPG